MAAYVNHVLASFRNFIPSSFNTVSRSGCRNGLFNAPVLYRSNNRTIFTEERLKIDVFKIWRQRQAAQLAPMKEAMATALSKCVSESESKIMTEDVNRFMPLVGVDDLDLLENALKKLHSQYQSGDAVKTFNLGPGIIMTYYVLNEVERVMALIKDEELHGFFTEVSAHAVAFQLLYNNGRYQDVLDLFKSHMEMRNTSNIEGKGYPFTWTTIVLTSAYLLNTPESYEYALDLFHKMRSAGLDVAPRLRALVAALALKQGQIHIAYEICGPLAMKSLTLRQRGIATRSIQVIALAKLGKIDEALATLNVFTRGTGTNERFQLLIAKDAVDSISEAISTQEGGGTASQQQELQSILQRLPSEGRYSRSSLHGILTTPLAGQPIYGNQFQRGTDPAHFHPQRRQFQWDSFQPGGNQFQARSGQFQQRESNQMQQRSRAIQFQQPASDQSNAGQIPRYGQRQGYYSQQQPYERRMQYQQTGNQFQAGGQFQPGGNQFQQSSSPFQPTGHQFQQAGNQFQQEGGQFQQGGGQFQQGAGQFQQGGGQFQRGNWRSPLQVDNYLQRSENRVKFGSPTGNRGSGFNENE